MLHVNCGMKTMSRRNRNRIERALDWWIVIGIGLLFALVAGCATRRPGAKHIDRIQPPMLSHKVTDHPLQLALGFLPRPNDGITLHQIFTNGVYGRRVFLWAEFPAGTMYTISANPKLSDTTGWFSPPYQVITETNVSDDLPYDKTGQMFYKLMRRK